MSVFSEQCSLQTFEVQLEVQTFTDYHGEPNAHKLSIRTTPDSCYFQRDAASTTNH